jgi:hypothetical protein
MQAVMNLVWETLLPAMRENALPEDTAAVRRLTAKLAGSTLRTPAGSPTGPLAARTSRRRYQFPENARGIQAVALDFDPDSLALVVRTAGGETRTPIGIGSWVKSRGGFTGGLDRLLSVPPHPLIAASGAAASVFTVKLVLYETHTAQRWRSTSTVTGCCWTRSTTCPSAPRNKCSDRLGHHRTRPRWSAASACCRRLNMSNMIGIGPFITIPLLMSALGGPQAMLGWLVALVIVLCDSTVWSELGAALPGSGGSFGYLRQGYGAERAGRLMGFLFVWQFVLSGPLEIASGYIGFSQYLGYIWKGITARWRYRRDDRRTGELASLPDISRSRRSPSPCGLERSSRSSWSS